MSKLGRSTLEPPDAGPESHDTAQRSSAQHGDVGDLLCYFQGYNLPYNPVLIPVTTTLLPRPFTANRICDKEAFACDIATVRPQQKATRLLLGLLILPSHELVIRELSTISIDTGFFRRLSSCFWFSPKYSHILFSHPPSTFRRASHTSSK